MPATQCYAPNEKTRTPTESGLSRFNPAGAESQAPTADATLVQ